MQGPVNRPGANFSFYAMAYRVRLSPARGNTGYTLVDHMCLVNSAVKLACMIVSGNTITSLRSVVCRTKPTDQ